MYAVSHPVLLAKLRLLGIQSRLNRWIEDFLVERSITVHVKGNLSSPPLVTSGVPQGSVFGPILFLVFVNHVGVASNLTCQYKIRYKTSKSS